MFHAICFLMGRVLIHPLLHLSRDILAMMVATVNEPPNRIVAQSLADNHWIPEPVCLSWLLHIEDLKARVGWKKDFRLAGKTAEVLHICWGILGLIVIKSARNRWLASDLKAQISKALGNLFVSTR